jgi:hypothetical protein
VSGAYKAADLTVIKISRYCDLLGEDRLKFLIGSTKEDIMAFLKWIPDVYNYVKKKSSLHDKLHGWLKSYAANSCHLIKQSLPSSDETPVLPPWRIARSAISLRMTSLRVCGGV